MSPKYLFYLYLHYLQISIYFARIEVNGAWKCKGSGGVGAYCWVSWDSDRVFLSTLYISCLQVRWVVGVIQNSVHVYTVKYVPITLRSVLCIHLEGAQIENLLRFDLLYTNHTSFIYRVLGKINTFVMIWYWQDDGLKQPLIFNIVHIFTSEDKAKQRNESEYSNRTYGNIRAVTLDIFLSPHRPYIS